jgi:hypothetical protein
VLLVDGLGLLLATVKVRRRVEVVEESLAERHEVLVLVLAAAVVMMGQLQPLNQLAKAETARPAGAVGQAPNIRMGCLSPDLHCHQPEYSLAVCGLAAAGHQQLMPGTC